jgi:uncharacterized protein (TIGR03000 family)
MSPSTAISPLGDPHLKTFLNSAAIGAVALALTLAMSTSSSAAEAAQPNAATIELSVPPDARVWFDDNPTVQTGSERRYYSPPLTPGQTYSYVITAQWRGPDGADVVKKETVSVRANESSNVEFVPRTLVRSGYYDPAPVYSQGYYPGQPVYYSGYSGRSRGYFGGYYRVGNVIINGRRWGDIGYRYSHGDLIRW